MKSGPPLQEPIDINSLLRNGLASKADEPALISANQRLSWREIDEASARLAGHYLDLGLKPGDRLASLMPNCPELLIHYLACFKAGLVITPLNYRYQAPEMDHALGVSQAAMLVAHNERKKDVAASQLASRLGNNVLYSNSNGASRPSLASLLNAKPKNIPLPQIKTTHPAFIFFTSGSTGKPKGVTHSRETFGWMMAAGVKGFEITAADILFPGSSISHIGGFLLSFLGLATGAPVLLPRTFDGDELLPLLREDRPTILLMLPAALFTLVREHSAERKDFSSLRICISGGDKVSQELEKEFTELTGFNIDECYGMSEIGYTTASPPAGPNKLGSVGPLFPGFKMSIRDEAGKELGPNQQGRLWIQSKSTMAGYWDNTQATQETIQDGWLDTGDIMSADEDGYLWFHGRKKQIIVHDGSNICPQEVEEAVMEHPAVENAGVIGIHNLVHGENVRAYVSLKQGAQRPTRQDLIQFARKRVGYKAPEEIVFLDEMPINAVGKVDRVTLKKMAEALHTPG